MRYRLDSTLMMVLMGVMSGYTKYREIADFAKRHEGTFTELFSLKHGVPSHVTIREIILNINFSDVVKQFNCWAQSLVKPSESPVVINIDGKGIRSTLQDYSSSHQDFVCFAHAYAAECGIVIQTASYRNKETSEIPFVQELIAKLAIRGALITLDALHAQKKQ
jgi:hypothetical protein